MRLDLLTPYRLFYSIKDIVTCKTFTGIFSSVKKKKKKKKKLESAE